MGVKVIKIRKVYGIRINHKGIRRTIRVGTKREAEQARKTMEAELVLFATSSEAPKIVRLKQHISGRRDKEGSA